MRPTILATSLLLSLVIAGCGGGSGEGTASQSAASGQRERAPSARSVADADTICSQMIAKSSRLGAEFSAGSHSNGGALALTTQLIEPAIPIVEDSSRRLRALKSEAASVKFDAYVNLFDPILALLRERVAAGEAGDPTRAHDLELQLIDISSLQRGLARQAGLKTCDVDFIQTFAASSSVK